jgi:poly [ADP-ribose] polymerase
VFRLERPGEAERFAKWEKANEAHIGDRRLLWHGSPRGNFAGILSQGLRRDGIISPNGKDFCQGVFFADISTKSARYCRAVPQAEVLMLLCEVELGQSSKIATRKIGTTTHNKWRDAGYIHPDFRGFKVPDVHGGTKESTQRSVYFNSEYIAHDPAQVIQRYLFHIKLK